MESQKGTQQVGQVAFDTLQFVETLESAGLPKDQAKAISLAVRQSHEAVDVATKRDVNESHQGLSTEIASVKRDVSDVRRDLSAEIADVRKDMVTGFEKTDAQIADVRKDMETRIDKLGLQLTVRVGGMLVVAIGALTAILRMPL